MTTLREWLRGARAAGRARAARGRPDPGHPAAVWHEEELLNGEVVDAVAAVLRTGGCSHDRDAGGCTMCGYYAETPARPPTEDELLSQVREVEDRREDARWVKLYTSGSMLDPGEVPPRVLDAILDAFGDAAMLTVESRAEHVSEERVRPLAEGASLEVAIGLESACDAVLERGVGKGMDLEAFRGAVSEARDAGASVRAYVLLKPPFLTEAEALDDAVEAMLAAADAGAATVSLNPVNVQAGTLVDHLHHRGEYEPPWLWSVVEALRLAEETLPEGVRALSAPTAGGTRRGAHNCSGCDRGVLDAISDHRLGRGARALEEVPACGCQRRWRAQLVLEGLEQGPFAPRGYRRG